MNRNVVAELFLPRLRLSGNGSPPLVPTRTPGLQALAPSTSPAVDIFVGAPCDDLFPSLPHATQSAAAHAVAEPSRKRQAASNELITSSSMRTRRKASTRTSMHDDPAATSGVPWYRRTTLVNSLWTRDHRAWCYSPEQQSRTEQIIEHRADDPSVLDDLHLMMAHLASPIEPQFNGEIFHALMQIPHQWRSSLAEALKAIFEAPAAASASVRLQLIRKLPKHSWNDALDALHLMLPYTRVTDSEMLLQIFVAIRDASALKRQTILPRIGQYLQVSNDPSGQCIAPLLRGCLRLAPEEALSFCSFLSHCHNADPDSIQSYGFETIRTAALVANSEQEEFLILLACLHNPPGQYGSTQNRPKNQPSPFFEPLARLEHALRTPAALAACGVFSEADDVVRSTSRQRLLSAWNAPAIQKVMHNLRVSLPTRDERNDQIALYSRAIARIYPGMRASIVQASLDLIKGSDVHMVTDLRLRMLEHFDIRRIGHTLYTCEQVKRSVQRTLAAVDNSICNPDTLRIYMAFLQCPDEQCDSLSQFINIFTFEGLSLRHRQCIVTEGLALGVQGRERMLQRLAPFAFTARHDSSTSLLLFLNLMYLDRHDVHYDGEMRMQQRAANSCFEDIPSCVALEVLYELQGQVLAHRQNRIQLSSEPTPESAMAAQPTHCEATDTLTTLFPSPDNALFAEWVEAEHA